MKTPNSCIICILFEERYLKFIPRIKQLKIEMDKLNCGIILEINNERTFKVGGRVKYQNLKILIFSK
jgi:hypothetical protein